MNGAVITALAGVAAGIAMVCGVMWRANRRTAPGVVRRLQAGRRQVHLRAGGLLSLTTGVWNPAQPYTPRTLIYGRGRIVYTLREGVVHAQWRPRHGPAQEFTGPVPERSEVALRRMRLLTWALVGYFAALALIGVAVGYFVGNAVYGILAIVIAMFLLPLLSTVARTVAQRRRPS